MVEESSMVFLEQFFSSRFLKKIMNFPASKAKNMKDDGISSGRYIYI